MPQAFEDHYDSNIDHFINNIINQKKMVELTLHNIYEIKLIDKDTQNVDTFYGVNLMTNWFFKNRYMGDADTVERTPYIMIGDGIDSTHQPSVENRAMYHIITTTYKSNDTSNTYYPLTYKNNDHMILQTIEVCTTKYDYNISGYSSDIQINEIGFGSSSTVLYSHSKVYDINGNEKIMTKRPNQSLEITLYWKISMPESVLTSLENDGIYGGLNPALLLNHLSNSVNNKPRIDMYLANSARLLAGYWNYGSDDHYYNRWYNYFGDTDDGSTIVQNDDGSRTWNTATGRTFMLETDKFDSVTHVLYWRLTFNNFLSTKCLASNSHLTLFKFVKLQQPETIETLIKTDKFYNCDFLDVIGMNYQYSTNNYNKNTNNADKDAQRWLRGYLPVVDMDIQSMHRYNFQTGEFDVEESFSNPKQNDYDISGFKRIFYEWITWPDNIARNTYICTNQDTTTRSVTKFSGTGARCYATDTWWDVSTWELVSNTNSVDPSLQNKKYYIFDKSIALYNSTSSLSYSSSDYWYPGPTFSFTAGVHKVTEQFARHIDEESALLYGYYGDAHQIMYANETANFYVQNNIVFRKPETEFSICPLQYIYNNVATIFGDIYPGITIPYLSNQMITNTGKVIYFLSQYYKTYNNITVYGVNFCITNLTLQNDAINSSTKLVSINDKFTHTLVDISNYCCATHGKYLICQQNNNSTNNEMIIYNTDTDEYWLYPYKTDKVREIYGTNKIIMNPSSDNDRWTIYDLDTKEILHQFDIPSDYAPTKFLAFEDWVYIYATYGSTHAMLLYTISTQEIKQIEYPSVIDNNTFCGFNKYKNTFGGPTSVSASNTCSFISNASMYNSCSVQYMDGILCISSLDYHNGFIIISKYNPENIIYQSTLSDNFSYSQSSLIYGLIQLCKIYENYYVGFTIDSSYTYDRPATKFFDIGRIIKNDKAFTSSNETEYQIDYLPYWRDGMNKDYINKMTVYKNKIYAYGNYFGGGNVEVLPPEGVITHKIIFKTNTITNWNNPKRLTLPKLSLTLTNIINHN